MQNMQPCEQDLGLGLGLKSPPCHASHYARSVAYGDTKPAAVVILSTPVPPAPDHECKSFRM
jgi:hypothetical protein